MYLAIFFLLLLVYFFWKHSSLDDKVVFESNDLNYFNLEKLVLSVDINKIKHDFSNNRQPNVYGLVLFENSSEKHKEIFAAYISGFSGYYKKGVGGIINGKAYSSSDNSATNNLLNLCEQKQLNGNKSNLNVYYNSIKLVIESSKYLHYAEQRNSWGSNSLVFCFLTTNGLFIKEVSRSEIEISSMHGLYKQIQLLKMKIYNSNNI
jgi:hypothetical protein